MTVPGHSSCSRGSSALQQAKRLLSEAAKAAQSLLFCRGLPKAEDFENSASALVADGFNFLAKSLAEGLSLVSKNALFK